MPIKFRKLKNPTRGTEIGYATIPLKDIDSPEIYRDISTAIEKVYDSVENGEYDRGRSNPIKRVAEGWHKPNASTYKMSDEQLLNPMVKELKEFAKSDKKEMSLEVLSPKESDPFYFSLRKTRGQILIVPRPFIHTIYRTRKNKLDTTGQADVGSSTAQYNDVLSILKEGFSLPTGKHWDTNALPKKSKEHRFNESYSAGDRKEEGNVTSKDRYSIELFHDEGRTNGSEYAIISASPQRILSVNIQLDKDASEEEKEKKMQFYDKEITGRYKVPVRFFDDSGKRAFPTQQSLEQKFSVIAIVGFLSSLFFIGSSVTGNAIADLTSTTSNFIGAGLFLIGIVGALFYFKSKNKF
jgi:hypothetical protein